MAVVWPEDIVWDEATVEERLAYTIKLRDAWKAQAVADRQTRDEALAELEVAYRDLNATRAITDNVQNLLGHCETDRDAWHSNYADVAGQLAFEKQQRTADVAWYKAKVKRLEEEIANSEEGIRADELQAQLDAAQPLIKMGEAWRLLLTTASTT